MMILRTVVSALRTVVTRGRWRVTPSISNGMTTYSSRIQLPTDMPPQLMPATRLPARLSRRGRPSRLGLFTEMGLAAAKESWRPRPKSALAIMADVRESESWKLGFLLFWDDGDEEVLRAGVAMSMGVVVGMVARGERCGEVCRRGCSTERRGRERQGGRRGRKIEREQRDGPRRCFGGGELGCRGFSGRRLRSSARYRRSGVEIRFPAFGSGNLGRGWMTKPTLMDLVDEANLSPEG